MAGELVVVVAASWVVGIVGAVLTSRIAGRSAAWAALLSPLTIVGSMAAGLAVGLHLMVIEDTDLVLLIVAATAPVALVVGAFVSVSSARVAAAAREAAERERRRQEVERGRRELMTWLSHDLRTPLAGIQAMGEAIEDGVAQDPQRYVRLMVSEAARTADMVADLMSLASLRTDGVGAAREELSLSDLASDMVAQLTPLADSMGVSLRLEGCDRDVTVMGGATLVSRAVQNVVANAVQYTRPGSTVTVEVRRRGEEAVVAVTDECGGLSEAEREHMVEVGWRGQAARTPSAQAGSGLGMPIVCTIVEGHGGGVEIDDAPGGCRISVVLPACEHG